MIRLLTLATILMAGVCLAAPAPLTKKVDYQKKADAAKWEWSDARATLAHAIKQAPGDYHIDVIPSRDTFGASTVRIFTRDKKLLYTLQASFATVFVIKDRVLYQAAFSPASSGCSVIAFDLRSQKHLWKAHLKGIGPIEHSKYRNQVTLEVDGDAVLIWGNESAGQYVEYVDRKTGKTVGHKKFSKG